MYDCFSIPLGRSDICAATKANPLNFQRLYKELRNEMEESSSKVALFAPNLLGGGAERIISILSSFFSQQGLGVDLLLGKAIGPYLEKIPSSVNVVDFGCDRILFTLPKLVVYLRKHNPDVLISSLAHSSTIALLAVRLAGVRTKVIIRQPSMLRPTFCKLSLEAKVRQRLLLWLAKKWSYKVVVTSHAMAEEFITLSKIRADNVTVIYNPLPIAEIRSDGGMPLDHPWFHQGQPPVVLAVGRLVRVKDFQTLIKAFGLVKKKYNARLLLLGEGPLRGELERLIREFGLERDINILGFVDNPFQYMMRSKLFVSSSLWEGFPNGLVEAMACGANILATSCDGGVVEILEHGKWGKLVPVQDYERMADGILEVLQSSDLPDTAQRAADFIMDDICCLYLELVFSGKKA